MTEPSNKRWNPPRWLSPLAGSVAGIAAVGLGHDLRTGRYVRSVFWLVLVVAGTLLLAPGLPD